MASIIFFINKLLPLKLNLPITRYVELIPLRANQLLHLLVVVGNQVTRYPLILNINASHYLFC